MIHCFHQEVDYRIWYRCYQYWMDSFIFKFRKLSRCNVFTLFFIFQPLIICTFHSITILYIYIACLCFSIFRHSILSVGQFILCKGFRFDWNTSIFYITCIKDLWAFSFNFGISSHAQLQINWSVIVPSSTFYIRDKLKLFRKLNDPMGLSGLSLWVSTLSTQFYALFIY